MARRPKGEAHWAVRASNSMRSVRSPCAKEVANCSKLRSSNDAGTSTTTPGSRSATRGHQLAPQEAAQPASPPEGCVAGREQIGQADGLLYRRVREQPGTQRRAEDVSAAGRIEDIDWWGGDQGRADCGCRGERNPGAAT